MAHHYVDAGVQTLIQGLARDPAARPKAFSPISDNTTTTPPPDQDDSAMAVETLHLQPDSSPVMTKAALRRDVFNASPTELLKKKMRPRLHARISMPGSAYSQDPLSPPPTQAMLSPLPAANRLHAGHTPLIPQALSPAPAQDLDSIDPFVPVEPLGEPEDEDEALSGPLTLPPQPGDGAADTFTLGALDAELERVRIEQEKDARRSRLPPVSPDVESSPSRSASSQPSTTISAGLLERHPPEHTLQSRSQTSNPLSPQSSIPELLSQTIISTSASHSENQPAAAVSINESFAARRRSSANSQGAQAKSRRPSEEVDGVLLKVPPDNFGAPLGSA